MHEVTFSDERVFLRVVDAGSIKAAAAQLGTDPSTVSRRLAALETRLGTVLLRRSTRRSTPTDAGARYADGLRRLFEQQQALEADVSGIANEPRGLLRITAPVDFGSRFVVPAIRKLRRRAPALGIELVLGSSFLDLAEADLDVAVRIGRLPDSSLIARRLGAVPRVLVAAPRYLRRHGTPRVPADLERHAFVLYGRVHPDRDLTLTAPDGRAHTVRLRGNVAVNSVSGVCALVEDGAGLHLGPLWAFREALAAGRVRAVLDAYHSAAYPLHALYTPSPHLPAKIRAFVDLMARHVKAEPALADR